MIDWPAEHFKPEEVLSPDGMIQFSKGNCLIQESFLCQLDSFRAYLGKPVLVNQRGLKLRGYRSPAENFDTAGSAPFSRHMQGIAADINVTGLTIYETAEIAEKFFNFVLLEPTWVHVDMGWRA